MCQLIQCLNSNNDNKHYLFNELITDGFIQYGDDIENEWGALIYKDSKGNYHISDMIEGTPTSVNFSDSIKAIISEGYTIVELSHTHPGGPNTFSGHGRIKQGDIYISEKLSINISLRSGDEIRIYKPEKMRPKRNVMGKGIKNHFGELLCSKKFFLNKPGFACSIFLIASNSLYANDWQNQENYYCESIDKYSKEYSVRVKLGDQKKMIECNRPSLIFYGFNDDINDSGLRFTLGKVQYIKPGENYFSYECNMPDTKNDGSCYLLPKVISTGPEISTLNMDYTFKANHYYIFNCDENYNLIIKDYGSFDPSNR